GASFRATGRRSAPSPPLTLLNSYAEIFAVRRDIRRAQEVRDAVRDCHQVYHLAANPNLWTRDRRDFDAVNNEGTRNVLHEALRAGAERVLHTSTESILVCAQSSDQSVGELRLT